MEQGAVGGATAFEGFNETSSLMDQLPAGMFGKENSETFLHLHLLCCKRILQNTFLFFATPLLSTLLKLLLKI
jgi:hypothetical protein